jgi:DNA-binding CsgD family transcriptional regulator
MSGSEKRNYTHIKALESEVLAMIEEGHTQREIAEHFGFKDKYVIKRFMN